MDKTENLRRPNMPTRVGVCSVDSSFAVQVAWFDCANHRRFGKDLAIGDSVLALVDVAFSLHRVRVWIFR